MKKLLTIGALSVLTIAPIFAQKGKVNSAEFNLTSGEVAKAKENIDVAFGNEEVKAMPKAWLVKGDVYKVIYELQDVHKDLYTATPNPLGTAKESYLKAFEVETNAKRKGDVTNRLLSLNVHFYNEGLELYKANNFEGAYNMFSNKVEISEFLNSNNLDSKIDTMGYFVLALSAYNSKRLDEAYKTALKLNTLKDKHEDYYSVILDIFKAKGDQENFDKTLAEGRKAYPNNVNLMYAEINQYLERNELDLLEDKLQKLIELEPSNHNLYLVLGTVYDRKGDIAGAHQMYDKALAIKPDYFDAYLNKAGLYNAEANKIIEQMNEETNDVKYEKLKVQRDEIFKNKMIPLLVKANQLDPKNENVIKVLKEIYARLDMLEEMQKLGK